MVWNSKPMLSLVLETQMFSNPILGDDSATEMITGWCFFDGVKNHDLFVLFFCIEY